MNAQELQDLLSERIGRTEAKELVSFIEHRPELATKNDIALVQKDLEVLKSEMKSYVDHAIGNAAWKVAGFLVAQAAVIVTLVKLL